jgi:SNF2 family DNA or RNA helicase
VLAFAPGTGKTPTIAAALREAGAQQVLAVVPGVIVHHWQNELGRWYPEIEAIDGRGSKAQRARARERMQDVGEKPICLILNHESFRIDIDELTRLDWDTLVGDEAHKWKGRFTRVTRAANRLARQAPRVWLVTGTPIPNQPDEAWSLLHLLHPDLFPNYYQWVGRWMETREALFPNCPRPVRVITGLKPGAIEGISEELSNVLLQRSLEELLPDLPEVTQTTIEVDLDDDERQAYEDLRLRHWTQLDGEVIETTNVISRFTRYRQIVGGLEVLGAERKRPGSKVRSALELIEDISPAQVVTLTWSRAAAERIAKEAGGVFVHGGVSLPDRRLALERFERGEVRVLAGTIATIGEGTDGLQVAHHLIRLERDWTPSRNSQALARIRRSGQQSPAIFCWDIVALDTIDQTVERALRRKEDVLEALLNS